MVTQVAGNLLAVVIVDVLTEVGHDLTSKAIDHLLRKDRPRFVVRLAIASGPRLCVLHIGARQHHRATVNAKLLVASGHALALSNSRADHVGHVCPAFDHRNVIALTGGDPHATHEPGESGRHRARFAERRQHVVDITQKGRRWTDEQHPTPLQQFAVVVEQVRSAVKRNRRLSGARSTLDHERTLERRTNNRILLSLDRCDDVAHPSGSPGVERSKQGTFSGEVCFLSSFAQRLDIKNVILNSDDASALGGEVAPAHDACGVGSGGRIERCRGRSAPVGEQWRELRIRQADAAYIETFAVGHVEAPEAQPVFNSVELSNTVFVQRREGVAFGPVLRRS